MKRVFTGQVSQDEIEFLGNCSALVLPSLFEGFGLVLLEAFEMSKPVLVADVKPFDDSRRRGSWFYRIVSIKKDS